MSMSAGFMTAVMGNDVDQPRHLGKSVTTECPL